MLHNSREGRVIDLAILTQARAFLACIPRISSRVHLEDDAAAKMLGFVAFPIAYIVWYDLATLS